MKATNTETMKIKIRSLVESYTKNGITKYRTEWEEIINGGARKAQNWINKQCFENIRIEKLIVSETSEIWNMFPIK